MKREREPQFTPEEEERIDFVVTSLLKEGEGAIDRLRQTRLDYILLEYATLIRTGSVENSRIAGGRTIELANEAIKRAQKELEERGEDRISQLKKIAKK
jgi:hypothetical protein